MTLSLETIGRALLVPFAVMAFAFAAQAEEATKPAATTAKPVETAKPATTAKADAAATEKKVKKARKAKDDQPKAEKGKKHKSKKQKAKSACSGLDQTACGANSACAWIVPKHHKKHKLAKPYCRVVAGVALKHAKPMPPAAATQAPAKAN